MAAPTRRRPCSSRVANGNRRWCMRSRAVMRPSRRPPSSTSGSFFTLRSAMIRSASDSSSGPRCTTSRSSGVIRSETSASRSVDEAHVALGQEPFQLQPGIDDDERADPGSRHEASGLADRGRCVDAVGVADDAMLRPLDDLDLTDLRLDLAGPEAAVDDADPALFGLHDGHRRAGHRVHVGRDDRALQRDPA